MPLIELIEKIPKYAKFLKDIMSRHRKTKVGEQVNLSASSSVISSRQVPQKLKNLGSFTIPIEIGSIYFNRLAERSSVHPKGVLEHVLVKECSFIIPTDFVVLDFEEDCEIPILLGRPSLPTSRSTIDLEKKRINYEN
ncbi:hypothetical protein EPI10_005093 [Gossypium australe]|uniref:Uncharacterized protein n=1 Tax=Gossypium australe TaxID=47621 RepID=A0A5B6WLW8_9ROSI|nr:hypothetical protein EPI10_005093 [Gossypium australe]